jgi:uncharacterized membrane protein YkoI
MRMALMFCMLILFLSTAGTTAEKKVQLKDLPPAAQKFVQDLIRGAELKGLSQEEENGKIVYEIETIKNGKARDILIDSSGSVLESEEATTLDEIPVPAKAAIEKAAVEGKITRVETVTRKDITHYEAVITKAGKKSEIKVAADGSTIK